MTTPMALPSGGRSCRLFIDKARILHLISRTAGVASVSDLARQLTLHPNTLHRILNGQRHPSWKTLTMLCCVFKVQLSTFIRFELCSECEVE